MQFNVSGAISDWENNNSSHIVNLGADGLDVLLPLLAADDAITRTSWLAYMIATVEHETAFTFQPIREYGLGANYPYGKPISVTLPDGTVVQNTYYGRGYVQLTLMSNYSHVGALLGMGMDLVYYPDKVLEPGTAYTILSGGMRGGWFIAGQSLETWLNDNQTDFVGARAIINTRGDMAPQIAGLATTWYQRLLANPAS